MRDRAAEWATGREVDEVMSMLGSSDIPERDQVRYEGCPGCLVYNLRMRGLSFDYLVLHHTDGVVRESSIQRKRFN